MVGVLEMNRKAPRKERLAKWWKIEGKIECAGALVLLLVLVIFWEKSSNVSH